MTSSTAAGPSSTGSTPQPSPTAPDAAPVEREYAVLLHGDEPAWLAAGEEQRATAYADHGRFTEACAAAGHTITGGAELAPSTAATVVRRGPGGGPAVTDGPYAEAVEQLGGYYVIRTADLPGLTRLVADLLGPGETAEIREQLSEQQPTEEQPTEDGT